MPEFVVYLQQQQQKEEGKKLISFFIFYIAINFTNLLLNFLTGTEKLFVSIDKELSSFKAKNFTTLLSSWVGSGLRGHRSEIREKTNPESGSRGQKSAGSWIRNIAYLTIFFWHNFGLGSGIKPFRIHNPAEQDASARLKISEKGRHHIVNVDEVY